MNKKNLRKGFTTVELVIVIAVIAILATALIPTFGGLIDSANETKDMNAARQYFNDYLLENAAKDDYVDTFYIHSGSHYYKVADGSFDSKATTTITEGVPVYCLNTSCDATNPTDVTAP